MTAVERLEGIRGTDGAMSDEEKAVMNQVEALVKKFEDSMEVVLIRRTLFPLFLSW